MSELPPTPSDPEDRALTSRVARGAAWVLGAGLLARFFGALNTIVVARLLVPEDIGLVAIATILMQLLQGFSDIGVSQAVVKFRNADRDDLDTLFTISVLRGLIIGAILIIAAPFAVEFYDDPRIGGVFLGVAAFPVLTGFINPKFYEFERDLKFSKEFISTVLNKFAGVAVSVAIAFAFRTYWAIILGLLTGGFVQLVLSYWLRPYRPQFSFQSMEKVLGVSGWLAGVSFLAALNNKLDVPILARFVGAGGAGAYFIGFQLSELVSGQIAMPLTRALYPGLSSLQGDNERMTRAYLRGVSALGAIAMPCAFGLAFVAEDSVAVLLGERWTAAVPVIQYLAPVVALQSLFFATQSYAIARGLTRLVFYRELVFLLVRLPIFIWATVKHGLAGAIYATALLGVFHIVLNLVLYSRASGRAFWEPLLSAWRSLAAVGFMAAYFLLLRPHLSIVEAFPLLVRLSVDMAVGAGLYVAGHTGLWLVAGRPKGVEQEILNALSALQSRFQKS